MSAVCIHRCVKSSSLGRRFWSTCRASCLRQTPVVCSETNSSPLLARFGFTTGSGNSFSTLPSPTTTGTSTTTTIATSTTTVVPRSSRKLVERKLSCSAAAVQLDDFEDDDQDDYYDYNDRYHHHQNTSSTAHNHSHDPKHCVTCTCPEDFAYHNHAMHLRQFENHLVLHPPQGRQPQQQQASHITTTTEQSQMQQPYNENTNLDEEEPDDYPPPLPEPKVTFRRRVLPENLLALSDPIGQVALMRALQQQTAATYFMLTQHWDNQSDPSSCGVTTLRQVLNAAGMDPTAVRWKGGWRYYGSDAMVVCRCMDPVRIQRAGITLDEFVRLAHCHGLEGRVERPDVLRTQQEIFPSLQNGAVNNTVDDFRNDILESLQTRHPFAEGQSQEEDKVIPPIFLVVSFSRAVLQQTGDGHFSTVAAYDAETDSALVLDVARFKYPPYWVKVQELYDAMKPADPVTKESRGWSLWSRPDRNWPTYLNPIDGNVTEEGALPATWVPAFDQTNDATCPLRPIQVQYCSTAWERRHHHQQQKGSTRRRRDASVKDGGRHG